MLFAGEVLEDCTSTGEGPGGKLALLLGHCPKVCPLDTLNPVLDSEMNALALVSTYT